MYDLSKNLSQKSMASCDLTKHDRHVFPEKLALDWHMTYSMHGCDPLGLKIDVQTEYPIESQHLLFVDTNLPCRLKFFAQALSLSLSGSPLA